MVEFFPPGLHGLLLAAVVAAVMSGFNFWTVAVAGNLAVDVLRPHLAVSGPVAMQDACERKRARRCTTHPPM